RVYIQPVAADFGVGSLDDSNGTFLSAGSSAKRQDRVCKRIHDKKLIMYLIVANVVHRPGQFAHLAVYSSGRRLCSVRQPGERRNLRMGHSVRHQNLAPLRIISDGPGITDIEGRLVGGSSPDYS